MLCAPSCHGSWAKRALLSASTVLSGEIHGGAFAAHAAQHVGVSEFLTDDHFRKALWRLWILRKETWDREVKLNTMDTADLH